VTDAAAVVAAHAAGLFTLCEDATPDLLPPPLDIDSE